VVFEKRRERITVNANQFLGRIITVSLTGGIPMKRFFTGATCLAIVVALGMGIASGQNYPSKPIRIVTASAGGSNDFTARIVAQGLASAFGQQVIVDNRAGGAVQVEVSSKAPPDGYTLLLAGGSLITNPLLTKVSYDPVTDYSPVITVERSVNFVVVHPSVPVKSIKELIALAKARPGELNYASAGTLRPSWLQNY
jgi:tripartite-type tricarboxylate transporter receptor subunit TctC